MRTVLAGLLLTTSCTRYVVAARPPELVRHAGELATHESADVFGPDGTIVRVRADDQVDVVIDDEGTQRPARLAVRELVAGCVTPDSPGCVANRVGDSPLVLRSGYRFDRAGLYAGLTVGVMGGAIGACIAACDQGSELAGQMVTGAVVTAGVVFLVVLLLHSGGRD